MTLASALYPRHLAAALLAGACLLLGCTGGGSAAPAATSAPAPVIASFQAGRAILTAGSRTELTAVFTHGTGTVDQGVGAITSGTPVSIAPAATTAYTLTVTGHGSTTQGTTVQVVPVAAIAGFEADASRILAGGEVHLRADFSHGTGTVDPGRLPVSSGQALALKPAASTVYTLTVTNPAGDAVTRSVQVDVQPVAVSAITPAAPVRATGTSTPFSATVSGAVDARVLWSASAGSMDAASGLWTAPATPQVVTITATARADASRTATTQVTVQEGPAIAAFSASPASLDYGGTATLRATYSGGTGVVEPGGLPLPSGGSVQVAPTHTTEYTLTVNGAGISASARTTVTVAGITVGAIQPADPIRSTRSRTPFRATVAGSPNSALRWSASAGTMDSASGEWTAPATPQVVTITAASAADPSRSSTTRATVVAEPQVLGFAANPATITAGEGAILSYAFTGGTGALDGLGAVSSGGTTNVRPGASTTYRLTVTNPAGDTATRTAALTVVPAPVITGFAADPATVAPGGTTRLTAAFTGGTGRIQPGDLEIQSGQPLTMSPAGATTYTLTVTNPAGSTATASIDVKLSGGALRVTLSGLLSRDQGLVQVHGPAGYEATVTRTTLLEGLAPGAYLVSPSGVSNPYRQLYQATPPQDVALADGEAKGVTVSYTLTELLVVDLLGGVPMELVRIPAGSFTMGNGAGAEGPLHTVKLEKGFWLCRTEVTVAQWTAMTGGGATVNGALPATGISPDALNDLVKAMNKARVGGHADWFVPTEAQWEYACRAGSTAYFSWGSPLSAMALLPAYGWTRVCNPVPSVCQDVAQLLPNPWGLFDMHGNGWEIVADDWHDSYAGAPEDGTAWADAAVGLRVVRGGAFGESGDRCGSGSRGRITCGESKATVAFRLALPLTTLGTTAP